MNSAFTIFAAALITEGLLVIVSYIVAGLFEVRIAWNVSLVGGITGVGLAIPVLFINHAIWLWSLQHPDSVFARFSKQAVIPLCKQVSPPLAFVIALMSGFGEEIFFRGVANTVVANQLGHTAAALITSVIFAYVHFIGNVKRFGGMMPLYSAVGLYLWTIHFLTHSLFTVFVTHAAYNFLAILWIRHQTRCRTRHDVPMTRT